MDAARLRELANQHPWMPADYLRVLATVDAGRERYGLTWFDGPQSPASMLGPSFAATFPTALWIGRRHGQVVGYESFDAGEPSLCEWGGSQRQVVRRFNGMDNFILSQRDPLADARPVVRHRMHLDGVAFGPWHDAGDVLVADCLLSPGLESLAIDSVLARLEAGWELCLVGEDNDSWLTVRLGRGGFELLTSRHGSFGEWRPASRAAAHAELSALAHCNSGALPQHFGSMTVPRPA
jgi:hypothetical protein